MTYLLELVTAFVGCCSVLLGCLCVWRLGKPNECAPAIEQLSWRLIMGGAVAVVIAVVATAVIG